MGITIIIVNWNGGDLLLRCLRSIRESKTSCEIKVIVIDNNSSDGSRQAAMSRFPEFEIINSGANLGFGRANNLARSRVGTPLVAFMNPDAELGQDTLDRLVHCLGEHPEVGMLGPKMLYPSGEVQELGLQWFPSPLTVLLELLLPTGAKRGFLRRWLPILDPNKSGYLRKLYGGFVLARKDALDEAGWFDERYFMYAEDVDLSRTIRRLGWQVYYDAEAVVVHIGGGTSSKAGSGFSTLMKAQSVEQLISKYQGGCAALLYRLAILIGAAIRLLASLAAVLIGKRSRREIWKGAAFRYGLLFLWALGLRRPKIMETGPFDRQRDGGDVAPVSLEVESK